MIKYRRDIDGLRALAILPVLFFHFDVPYMSGGYIGVDIFFVISGFLITSVIMGGLEKGNFTIKHFYERRARRLLPALFSVLIFCLIAGLFVMSPVQYQDMGATIVAAVFFVANILLWSKSGYFQSSAEYDPLLHAWTLSVEEQFYIFFPLLLVLFVKTLKKNPFWILAFICLGSLVLSIWGVANKPNPTFYLLPTRIWELGCGALLAMSMIGSNWNAATRNILSAIGVLAILLSIVLYKPTTPFPGMAALPPVLGTALIIAAGRYETNAISKFLSIKPLVAIGLISYSLYLWHWPIITFLKIHFGAHDVPVAIATLGLIASIVIAAISWKYIEQPFRSPKGFSGKAIFTYSGIGIALSSVIGAILFMQQGFPDRFDPRAVHAFRAAEGNPYRDDCLGPKSMDALCVLGTKDEPTSFILWGDSHAMSAAHGFNLAGLKNERSGVLAAHSDCPPLIGLSASVIHRGASCEKFRQEVFDFIKSSSSIETVILHARWPRYSEKSLHWEKANPPMFGLLDENIKPLNIDYSYNYIDEGIMDIVQKLQAIGKTIVIVETVPEQSIPVAYTVGRHLGFQKELPPAMEASHAQKRNRIFDRLSDHLEGRGLYFYNPSDILCADKCKFIDDDKPLYEDDNHLSLYGAELSFADFQFPQGAAKIR